MSKKSIVHDHELWEDVRRTIKPLQGRPKAQVAESVASHVRVHAARHHAANVAAAPGPVRAHGGNVHMVPQLQALDRRTAQRLGRGQLEPEARLDLHGSSVEMARITLLHFVMAQRQRGARLVLVITGKGASPFARHTLHGLEHFHAPEREGRLRRELSYWLSEEIFREHVVGFQPSHPRHGGGGAFYLRLRRNHGGHHGEDR